MTRNRLLYPLSAALAATLALAACKKPEQPEPLPPPATSAPVPMGDTAAMGATATVASVDLGNAVGADQRVTAPASVFAPTDTIYATVATRTSDPAASVPGTLSAKWTYQDGQTVHEDSRNLDLTGDGVTTFHINKPDGFPAGRYQVEVALDGTVVQSKDFEVK
ncbi:hypothetical protein B1992_05995 [Pseudoxanthomonas broegbernensis]|uniref:PKD domain-containing protein n=1 Tax=Pseudoxanthomonas broegbernensis TaxID=83619 RepID=A0A7V8GN66_9GAMM|nr:hypothetical protein [Pseudoxanthomonas broegbernensis]KAF1686934.1 hypothetical protein B1992_05995 [Pseudoxanthomonas broegbernensis]MBB6065467.1 hypothetical protein [Pseudoxanthomonas broegbernensis]